MLIGRTLHAGKPIWVSDVSQELHFPRAPAATQAGLRAALAFPVEAGGQILGIMEFFSCQAQDALRESEAHFRSLVEQASDSFYVHDFEGHFIDVNQLTWTGSRPSMTLWAMQRAIVCYRKWRDA